MRCLACNGELSDDESTRQNKDGEDLELCNSCYNRVKEDVTVATNQDTSIVEHGLIDRSINLFVNDYTNTIDNE